MRGVDQVEVLDRGRPGRHARRARSWCDCGTRGSVTPVKPQQSTRLLHLASAAAEEPAQARRARARSRRPRRPRSGSSARPLAEVSSSVGLRSAARSRSVSTLRTRTQVTKPTAIGRYDTADGVSWTATAATPSAARAPNTSTASHQAPRRQVAGPGEGQGEEQQDPADQQRLVRRTDGVDGLLDQGARGQPDDELGDGDDRRVADREHVGDDVARGQTCGACHQARQRPGATEGPHTFDCRSGMIIS